MSHSDAKQHSPSRNFRFVGSRNSSSSSFLISLRVSSIYIFKKEKTLSKYRIDQFDQSITDEEKNRTRKLSRTKSNEMIVSTIIHDIPSNKRTLSLSFHIYIYIYIHRMLGEQITRECRSNSHTFYREKFPDSPDANLLPLFRKKKKQERIDGKYGGKDKRNGEGDR